MTVTVPASNTTTASHTSLLLEVNGMSVNFGSQDVLKNITLSIPQGQTLVILGESGCGKTVLLKTIIGLIRPTDGDVLFQGDSLLRMNDRKLAHLRTRYGFVFQGAALFDSYTIADNIAFPLREHTHAPSLEIDDIVSSLTDEVGLPRSALQKKPMELSGGMRKRAGLARALALDPELILYDEPTTGLDPITTHMVDDLITSTHNHNAHLPMTSVIISHDIAATLRISDYVAFLEKGKTVVHAPVEEFRKSDHPVIKKFIELST